MDAGPPSEGTPLALDEVRDDVARLRGEMARDVCKISADLLKAVGGTLLRGLLAVLIVIWQSTTIPPDRKRGLVVTIRKEIGDRQDCNKLCSISLFSVPGKMLAISRANSHLTAEVAGT